MLPIESVLGAAIIGTFALELAVDLFSVLAFSSATTWASVRTKPSCAIRASSALSRVLVFARSWRNQTARTPNGEIDKPCFFSSLETRT